MMPEGPHSRIQSILFSKELWSLRRAIGWLERHRFRVRKVDETDRFYRFRQYDPRESDRYRTLTLDGGIEVIINTA